MHTDEEIKQIGEKVVEDYAAAHPIEDEIEGKTIAPAVVQASTSISAPSGFFTELEGDSITGDSIIENMTGYSMSLGSPENATLTAVYGGLVKNGNKLTLVLAVNIKRTGTMAISTLASIVVPSDVGSKIYVSVGSNTVARGNAYCVNIDGAAVDDKEIPCSLLKQSNTALSFVAYEANELEANTDYYLRVEFTLLLSSSLI